MRSLVFVLLLAAPAFAQEDAPEKQQARVLLGQGNALFERGDLKGALADFRAAYALYPSPKLLVNAAAAERELGDLPAAANDLRRFLDEAEQEDPFLVDRARQDLKALERRVGRVSFIGWPAKSGFEIDGRTARDTTYVRPGGHRVKARAPNGVEDERDGSINAGEALELAAPSRAGAAPMVAASSSHDSQPINKPKKSRAWIAGVVVGVIVVAAGVGLGLGFGLNQQNPQPLKGDLGSYNFSMFH